MGRHCACGQLSSSAADTGQDRHQPSQRPLRDSSLLKRNDAGWTRRYRSTSQLRVGQRPTYGMPSSHPRSPSFINSTTSIAILQPLLQAQHQNSSLQYGLGYFKGSCLSSLSSLLCSAVLKHSVIVSPHCLTLQHHNLAQVYISTLSLILGQFLPPPYSCFLPR